MSDQPDTADLIRDKATGTTHFVACSHSDHGYGVVYTAGYPSRTLRATDCEILYRASESERLASLRAMAAVQSNQHRPVCARARLEALEPAGYESGSC